MYRHWCTRGCGRPTITVYSNAIACLVFGYPVALLLVFVADMGLAGVWLGMCMAWFVASIMYHKEVVREGVIHFRFRSTFSLFVSSVGGLRVLNLA